MGVPSVDHPWRTRAREQQHLAERRQRVLELRQEGRTHQEIADELGISRALVNADLMKLRRRGAPVPDRRYQRLIDRDLVEREWNFGFPASDIARHLGVTADRVRHVMQEMREEGRALLAEHDPRRCT